MRPEKEQDGLAFELRECRRLLADPFCSLVSGCRPPLEAQQVDVLQQTCADRRLAELREVALEEAHALAALSLLRQHLRLYFERCAEGNRETWLGVELTLLERRVGEAFGFVRES